MVNKIEQHPLRDDLTKKAIKKPSKSNKRPAVNHCQPYGA